MAFDFRMDKFPKSYSGVGKNFGGFLDQISPIAGQVITGMPGQQQQLYGQARNDINTGFNDAISQTGKTFQDQLEPALQQVMNNLNRKGMLNSSMAGNVMSQTARGLGKDIIGDQTQLRMGRQGALSGVTQQEANNQFRYPELLAGLLSQAKYSESSQENVPYQNALGFLERLMM